MSIATDKNIIEVRNLYFQYHNVSILENINFSVDKADYLGIIGPNGSGKSTLIKLILGLLKPDKGSIKIFGHDLEDFKEKYKIAYLPQGIANTDFPFPVSVQEIIKSGFTPKLSLLEKLTKKNYQTIEKVIAITSIHKLLEKLFNELSGGEKQLVFIARALVGNPQILILDEPTTGVDIASQEKFYTFLKVLNHKHDLTIIFISHDLEVITKEVNHIMCLNKRLVCHTHTKNFNKEKYLKELYGENVSFITHRH